MAATGFSATALCSCCPLFCLKTQCLFLLKFCTLSSQSTYFVPCYPFSCSYLFPKIKGNPPQPPTVLNDSLISRNKNLENSATRYLIWWHQQSAMHLPSTHCPCVSTRLVSPQSLCHHCLSRPQSPPALSLIQFSPVFPFGIYCCLLKPDGGKFSVSL